MFFVRVGNFEDASLKPIGLAGMADDYGETSATHTSPTLTSNPGAQEFVRSKGDAATIHCVETFAAHGVMA